MAELKSKLFKGFKQVVWTGDVAEANFEEGYVYFVRDDDSRYDHGYLFFNGKKYGTTSEVEEAINGLEGRISSAETDIDVLEGLLASAETGIGELEGRVSSAETDIDALEGRMASAETDIDALEGRMASAETDIDALEGRMASAETDIDTLDARITAVQTAVTEEINDAFNVAMSALNQEMSARVNDDVKDIVYDSSSQTIYVEFNDGSKSVGFSAAEFIKDGMLSSVTYDASAHTMTFIWNTEAGHEEMTVDMDNVIAPYEGDGQTISVNGNVISAIVDQENGVASHSALVAEASARTAADESLEGLIKAEESARTAAVDALEGLIEAEESARTAEDNALNKRIDELDTDDISIAANVSGVTSGSTLSDTLEDIYDKLSKAADRFEIDSNDNSVNVSFDEVNDKYNIELNREEVSDDTVAAGHIGIKLNESGETYAVMYYSGNDTEI